MEYRSVFSQLVGGAFACQLHTVAQTRELDDRPFNHAK